MLDNLYITYYYYIQFSKCFWIFTTESFTYLRLHNRKLLQTDRNFLIFVSAFDGRSTLTLSPVSRRSNSKLETFWHIFFSRAAAITIIENQVHPSQSLSLLTIFIFGKLTSLISSINPSDLRPTSGLWGLVSNWARCWCWEYSEREVCDISLSIPGH